MTRYANLYIYIYYIIFRYISHLICAPVGQREAAIFWSMVDPDGLEQFGTAWYYHRVTDRVISPTLTSSTDTGLTNPSNMSKFTPKTQAKLTLKQLKNKKVNGPDLNPNKNLCNYSQIVEHTLQRTGLQNIVIWWQIFNVKIIYIFK